MKIRHVVAGLAGGLILITTTAAYAAGPPYTVAVGGSTAAGTHSIIMATTGAVKISWKNDVGTVINADCDQVALAGNVTSGAGINPAITFDSMSWIGCIGFGGAISYTQNGPWNLTGTGTNATPGLETVDGYVGDVSADYALSANPVICSFTFSGQMNASFDEVHQQLVVDESGYTGNLTIELQNGSLCLGQLQDGNPMDFEATFDLVSVDGDINLS